MTDDEEVPGMSTDAIDDALLAELRRVASSLDPVPDEVVLAGRSAFAYRDLDLRLAALVDEPEAVGAGTRGDGEDAWFTFEVDDVVVEVAVRSRDGGPHVVGQVDGADVTRLVVHQQDTEVELATDELGRFAGPVGPGPLRLVLELADGPRVATSWIVAPRS